MFWTVTAATAPLAHPDMFELGLASVNPAGTTITFEGMIGRPFPGSCISIFSDWDMEVENASEDKYRKVSGKYALECEW